jgi:hypothetical protein
MFGLEVGHGILTPPAFDLLAMSYSPSRTRPGSRSAELSWQLPSLFSLPNRKSLTVFQTLTRNGFLEMPAQAYLKASESARKLLRLRLERLDEASQKKFFKVV